METNKFFKNLPLALFLFSFTFNSEKSLVAAEGAVVVDTNGTEVKPNQRYLIIPTKQAQGMGLNTDSDIPPSRVCVVKEGGIPVVFSPVLPESEDEKRFVYEKSLMNIAFRQQDELNGQSNPLKVEDDTNFVTTGGGQGTRNEFKIVKAGFWGNTYKLQSCRGDTNCSDIGFDSIPAAGVVTGHLKKDENKQFKFKFEKAPRT